MDEQKKDETLKGKATLGQTAAVFVPTAALATVGIEALLHAPLPIEIAGLVGAYMLARNSPAIYEKLRGNVPGLPEKVVKERKPGEYTLTDRLLGKHMRDGATTVLPDAVTEPLQIEPGGVLETTAREAAEMQQGPDAPQPVFEHFKENETLRLGYVAGTEQRFDPHVNGLIGQGLIAAAMQGWGKSQLVGRIVEQSGKCGMMVVLFDHKGEHETITELPYINGLRAGADASADFQLTADNAAEFVRLVMKKRHQAIINLPSYGIKWLDRATIVAAVGRELMNYAEEKRRKRERVMPCLVLLDEAQLYIPQDPTLLPPEAQENKQVLGELKNVCFALATNGRSAGYTMGFATQSLTFIAKWAIKSCAIQVFGRHVEKNALDMCESIIDSDVATRAEIKTFPKGQGVVFGFTEDPLVVQFDKKESRDLSETPTIEWLREPEKPAVSSASVAGSSGTLSIDQILALFESGKLSEAAMLKLIDRLPVVQDEDEEEPDTGVLTPEVIDFQTRNARREVPAEVEEEAEESESNVIVLGKGCQITREEYQVAYRMRARGVATGYRDLMEPFDLSEHHAKALNKLILEEMDVRARG